MTETMRKVCGLPPTDKAEREREMQHWREVAGLKPKADDFNRTQARMMKMAGVNDTTINASHSASKPSCRCPAGKPEQTPRGTCGCRVTDDDDPIKIWRAPDSFHL